VCFFLTHSRTKPTPPTRSLKSLRIHEARHQVNVRLSGRRPR
jgi:hypothetical protein